MAVVSDGSSGRAAVRPAYDAFVSYSHSADGELAPALADGLSRLTAPWYRRRALTVYLDRTGLEVTPGLWTTISRALDSSSYLVLLASPQAASSDWVRREVAHWLEHRPAGRILPVVTAGVWEWDTEAGDLDRARCTAVPEPLFGAFDEEPYFLDLRGLADRAPDRRDLTLRRPDFREAVAQLAAPIHGRPRDELDAEDLRRFRQRRRAAWSGVVALAVLLVIALIAAVLALRSAGAEATQRDLALARALAGEATTRLPDDPQLATLLALAGDRVAGTDETRAGLLRTLAETRRVRGFLPGSGEAATATAFSPDGRRLATGGLSGPIRIWDTEARRPVAELPATVVADLAYTPSGALVATDVAGTTIRPPGGEARRIGPGMSALYAAGDRVAGGGPDGRVTIWDARTGSPVTVLTGASEEGVTGVAVSPDGRLVAAGGRDGVALVRDVASGDVRARIEGWPITSRGRMAFSPDGATLALSGRDGAVLLWTTATGAVRTVKDHTTTVQSVAFDGSDVVMTADFRGNVVRRHLRSDDVSGASSPLPQTTGVAFAPGGTAYASGGFDGRVLLWGPEPRLSEPLPGPGALLPGATVAVDRAGRIASGDLLGSARIAAADGTAPVTFTAADTVNAVAFDPGGTRLAVGTTSARVELHDGATGALVRTLSADSSYGAMSVSWSPDGALVAAALYDGALAVWDAADGRLLRLTPAESALNLGFRTSVTHVVFTGPRTVAHSVIDGVVLRDAVTGTPTGRIGTAGGFPVTALAWSPARGLLALGSQDSTVALVDPTRPGEPVAVLAGQSTLVSAAAFSDDGSALVTGGTSGSGLTFWDTTRGSRQAVIADPGDVTALARTDTTLVAADRLTGLRRYDLDPARWRDRLCDIVGRDLTPAEWRTYVGDDREQVPLCP